MGGNGNGLGDSLLLLPARDGWRNIAISLIDSR